jgi:hypothetical protein
VLNGLLTEFAETKNSKAGWAGDKTLNLGYSRPRKV